MRGDEEKSHQLREMEPNPLPRMGGGVQDLSPLVSTTNKCLLIVEAPIPDKDPSAIYRVPEFRSV